MQPAIQLKYSCRSCGVKLQTVTVAGRQEGQDLKAWLDDSMSSVVGRNHAERSPLCGSTQFEISIPANAGVPLGNVVNA